MLKVGLILYSVREEMARDPIGTVEKVGKLGYRSIEVCNHSADTDPGCGFGVSAQELRAAFDRCGSHVISAHIDPLDRADLDAVVEYEQTLGNRNIVNPMGRYTGYDDVMRQIEGFNTTGRRLHELGMTYLYHNHHHEYRTYGGKSILDLIAENTDPDYVSLELDTFWTMRAGRNPVEMLKHFGPRVRLVHQKDFAWDAVVPINLNGITPADWEVPEGGEPSFWGSAEPKDEAEAARQREAYTSAFTEIGQGIMPIQAIIDTASACTNAEYIILEQDYTRMPSQIDSIQKSMESFRKFQGITWED